MVIGTGCDLLEICRMEHLKQGNRLERIFTEEERRQAGGRNSVLAGDFAVKEAVSKCFGTGIRGFSLPDIEVLRDELGAPYVQLYGGALARYEALGGQSLSVSISDTRELVMAFAVLEGRKGEQNA